MVELVDCVLGPCLQQFTANPLGSASLAIFGSVIALSLYMIAKKDSMRSRIRWSYPLVFSALFLLSYFGLSMSCHASLPICTDHAVMYSFPAAVIGSLLFGYIVLPRIYLAWQSGRRSASLSKLLPSNMPVYISDKGRPFAFSYGGFQKWIVVSQGMIDILTKKELQAVLLHEYGHISNNTSIYKTSNWIYSKIPLLHAFLGGRALEDQEELNADAYSVAMQGTGRHLNSAKRKLTDYFSC